MIYQRIESGSATTYTLRKYYDGLGRMIQSQVAGAVLPDDACSSDGDTNDDLCDLVVDYTYDADGNLVKQTTPYAVESGGTGWRGQQLSQPSTLTSYDLLGRPIQISAPDGTLTSLSYADGGQTQPEGYIYLETRRTDGLGRMTVTRSDLLGRVRKVIPPLGPGVSYEYDAADRLTGATYGTAVTSLSYDLAGRKLQQVDPDLGTWSYAYDALGNLVRQADARGQRACLYYDKLNRLTGKHYRLDDACPASRPNPSDVSYTYDAGTYGKSYRTGMADASGSTTRTYDARGRVIQETKEVNGSGSFASGWIYNSADLPATMTYPDGEVLSYLYHPQLALNKLLSNRDADNQASNYYLVQRTAYDAAGRMEERWLGAPGQASIPALVQDPKYNPWNVQGGRLQWLHAGTYADPAGLLNLAFGYDNLGNILTSVDTVNSGQKQCFGYDALDRLVSARAGDAGCNGALGNGEYPDESYSYRLDNGSLNAKTGLGTYIYGETSHPHAVIATSAGWTFQYDANGNMLRRDPPGDEYFDYQYDAENRLEQVKKNGVVLAAFTYDGDGARVKAVVNGVTTTFIGGSYEATSGGAVTKYYLVNGGRLAMRANGGLTYLFGDQLGSTSVSYRISDGQTIRQLYKAWGEPRYASASLPTAYTYTGQYSYMDALATPGTTEGFGLMFYNARWYDPYLNRWTSPDSIIPEAVQGVQAWDRYAYANNNPVRFNDPTGHCVGPLLLVCIGVTLIGGAVSIAAINTGIDQVAWASSQTKTIAQEQAAAQQWQDNCMGQCHYTNSVSPTPGVTIGTQRPDTPVSDILALGYYNIGQGAVGLAGSIAGLTRLGLTAAQPASATTTLTSQQLDDLATDVSDWVSQGGGAQVIRNGNGDFILVNDANTRRFRYDFFNTNPHRNPHMHLEWINDQGRWVKPGPIFPSDVDPQ